MKKYKVTAYALNHVWYREDWIVEAKSQKDAIAKANSQEGELEYSDQSDIETCRADFEVECIEELEKEEV